MPSEAAASVPPGDAPYRQERPQEAVPPQPAKEDLETQAFESLISRLMDPFVFSVGRDPPAASKNSAAPAASTRGVPSP